ncbi:hypothetical protein GCM10009837_07150 [Streptomyces durmitorensis]
MHLHEGCDLLGVQQLVGLIRVGGSVFGDHTGSNDLWLTPSKDSSMEITMASFEGVVKLAK